MIDHIPVDRGRIPALHLVVDNTSGTTYTEADLDPYEIDDRFDTSGQKLTPLSFALLFIIGVLLFFLGWAVS